MNSELLKEELVKACVSGPESLEAFIASNGLRLGTALHGPKNVLKLVLRSIVLHGASPATLGVLAKVWEGLRIDEQTNAVTELIMVEHDLCIESTEDDLEVLQKIRSTVKEISKFMPNIPDNVYSFAGRNSVFVTFGRNTLQRLALLNQAYNTFETIWPYAFKPLAAEVLFFQNSVVHHVTAAAQGALERLSKKAAIKDIWRVFRLLQKEKKRLLRRNGDTSDEHECQKKVVEVNLNLMGLRVCQWIFEHNTRGLSVESVERIAFFF
jgi:hypothetical protein